MADNYDDYSREELIRELRSKNQKPRFGLYWERDDIEHDRALILILLPWIWMNPYRVVTRLMRT